MWSAISIGLCLLFLQDAGSTQLCTREACDGQSCDPIPCVRGACSGGACVCEPCWIGRNCDTYKNAFYPEFLKCEYYREISPATASGEVILRLGAVDNDRNVTCPSRDETPGCSCAQLEYSIVFGNDDSLFSINRYDGSISINTGADSYEDQEYHMRVTVQNPHPDGLPNGNADDNIILTPYAVVVIKITENGWDLPIFSDINELDEDPNQLISRHRCSAEPPNTISEMAFSMQKTGDNENATEAWIGSRFHFELALVFPLGNTDILLELITPGNDTTVMALCSPEITRVGSNLETTPSSVQPVLAAKDGDITYFDRAILDFTVNNNNADQSDSRSSSIIVEFDTVMVDNGAVDGEIMNVSARVVYNETEMWIGQRSLTANTTLEEPATPSIFNLTGPPNGQMEIGSSAVFTLDMYIPHYRIDLSVEAFASINNSGAMSICSMSVVTTGPSYECLITSHMNPSLHPGDVRGNSRGTLDLGVVTNKQSRESGPWQDNLIQVEFIIHLFDDASYVGQSFWVGGAVETDRNTMWAGQIQINGTAKATKATTTSTGATPTFQLTRVSDVNVRVGEAVVLELDIDTPEKAEMDYSLEVSMPHNGNSLKLCQVTLDYSGINMPCVGQAEPVYSSRNASGMNMKNTADLDLGIIRNTGHFLTHPDANKIRIPIVAQVLDHDLKTDGEIIWITSRVTYDDRMWVGENAVILRTTNVTIDRRDSPIFNLSGPASVYVGGQARITLEMELKAGVVYAPMDLDIILPVQDNEAVFSVCRAEVIHVGKNMPCLDQDALNVSVVYGSRVNTSIWGENSTHDKVSLTMGSVFNVRGMGRDNPRHWDQKYVDPMADPMDDKIVFSLLLSALNHTNAANVNRSLHFDIFANAGPEFSDDDEIWVEQKSVIIEHPEATLDYPLGQTPFIEVIRDNDGQHKELAVNSSFVLLVVIKPPPASTADIRVTVTANHNQLSIGAIQIVGVGRNLGCLDMNMEANFTLGDVSSIDLGRVSNIGSNNITENSTFDDDTLELQVMVMLHSDAMEGNTYTVTTDVDPGMDGIGFITFNRNIIAAAANTPLN